MTNKMYEEIFYNERRKCKKIHDMIPDYAILGYDTFKGLIENAEPDYLEVSHKDNAHKFMGIPIITTNAVPKDYITFAYNTASMAPIEPINMAIHLNA